MKVYVPGTEERDVSKLNMSLQQLGSCINGRHGADISSASTINLETSDGEIVDVTGTTTITAITLNDGHECTVRFTGVLTLTHGASLVLPGSANITTAAGDFAVFRGYAAGVVRCVNYTRATGLPIKSTGQTSHTTTDQSGAGLSFSNVNARYSISDEIVRYYGILQYPATANASQASISLPVATPNLTFVQTPCPIYTSANTLNAPLLLIPDKNAAIAKVYRADTGAVVANSVLTSAVVLWMLQYPRS